jgi:hypothetical protein
MMGCATAIRPASPFPGLRPFQRQEASLFFGRSREVAELRTALLGERRFLAVVGTSGCGKSSLVEAGLLPRLLGEQTSGGRLWRVISLRPLGAPVAQLAASLATFAQAEQPDSFGRLHASMLASRYRATLRRTTSGLVDAAREILTDPATPVLIVVDQFEELFRYEPDETDEDLPLFRDEAQAFANLLLEAARAAETNIYVLITMRSDFFGECGRYRGLAGGQRQPVPGAAHGPRAAAGGDHSPALRGRRHPARPMVRPLAGGGGACAVAAPAERSGRRDDGRSAAGDAARVDACLAGGRERAGPTRTADAAAARCRLC